MTLGAASMSLGTALAFATETHWPGLLLFAPGVLLLAWGAMRSARREHDAVADLGSVAQRLRGDSSRESAASSTRSIEAAALEAGAAAREAAAAMMALRSAERDLRAMFDAVDVPVVATDAAGIVLMCNAAAGEFVGRPAPSLVGRRAEELFTQADLLDLLQSAREGHTHARQVRVPRPSGIRVFEVFVSPLARAAAAPGAIMTLRDVTDLARSVQVKTDFVVNASHELRTPIAALRMAAETLEGGAADDPAMFQRLLGMISGHVGRLEDLTHDLLDLSRLESPELTVASEPVPGSSLAEEMGQLFAGACRQRSLTLVFDFDPALERMKSDRGLLLLILKNLIENATKFANEGTKVRVVGRPVPEGDWSGVRFEVTDQGLGIPLNQQDRIFERFYQVDEARTSQGAGVRRGTGLGLAIVKHAVRTLGGSVGVQSVWKQGTTMIVELPACIPPDGDGADAQRAGR